MRIAVIGCGFVGGATLRWFQETHRDVVAHDPPKGMVADLALADILFVCVPTPYTASGHDTSIVDAAVAGIPGSKVVVVKSTVLPGTTDRLQLAHPQHKVLFCPEFLRERTAYDDFVKPDRQVVGITSTDHLAEARQLLSILPVAQRTSIVKATVAEMTKYFSNCYLSMKVTFANQVADLCGAAGIDYGEVKQLAEADPRIGRGYLDVGTDGYRGYGGTCFPKDMRSLVELGERVGSPMTVLEACEAYNCELLELQEQHQWLVKYATLPEYES
jgi:UDPglucose 6-dehydrogenase